MNPSKKGCFLPACSIVILAIFAGSLSVPAVIIPLGGLAATHAGTNLVLSFTTTTPKFYTVQTSHDLQQWTNCQPGIPGDGTVKSVTVTNATSSSQGFYRFSVQMPTSLVLPQSMAFSILGYSCGSISEKVSAGFSVTNGNPTGVVNLSTTCSGSGRDGGHSTTHTASAVVTWNLAANTISAVPLTNGVTAGSTTVTDGGGDVIYSSGAVAYLIVPIPAPPTGVTATQSNDQFQVSWKPRGVNPAAITSSTLTAKPLNSTASVLTTTVAGSATSGVITTLQPQTSYQITIVNTTIGGSSPPSVPLDVKTSPATVAPSAPTGVTATWSNPDPTGSIDTLNAAWQAANPGNSPVDEYLITIKGSDGGGTFTNTVSGTTLTTYFNVNDIPNWSVTVQAHNAAGWGPVSTAVNLGGL